MKSLFLTLYLVLFVVFFAVAQKYIISGHVIKGNNVSVAFANLSLNLDSVKIAETLSDSRGFYRFEGLLPGHYQLMASFLGEKAEQNVSIKDGNVITNVAIGAQSAKELKGITITGNKPLIERKMDRLVFNVENSIAALGGDASDVLKLTPGVNVTNDQISLIGKGAVNILINDRLVPMTGPQLLMYLKSVPADRIQKIEVITNPPAKYDAGGNSGLINIQLKSVPKENSWSAVLTSAAEFATYTSLSHGVNFTYKKDKFSMLTGLAYRYGSKAYTNTIEYAYPNDEILHNDVYNKNHVKTLGSLINLQYDLSPKESVGMQYSGSFARSNAGESTVSQNFVSSQLAKDYITNGSTLSRPKVNAFNMNYNHKIDSLGKKYSVDLDYFTSASPRNNLFNSDQRDLLGQSSEMIYADNNSTQNIENYSAKTDFELPNKWAPVTFGAKVSSTRTKNIVGARFYDDPLMTMPYEEQNDHFEYTENIQALYFSADKKINDRWSAKLGVRGEYTQTSSDSYSTSQFSKNRYFKLFPTAYLLYKINRDHSLNINFGRRIGRPGFWELNPARWYMNPQSYTEGNPFLQPSFSYVFELNYSYKSIVSSGVYYNRTQNGFGQVTFHDVDSETQIFQRLNYYNGKDIGGWAIISIKPVKLWDARLSTSAFYKESDNYIPLFNRDFSGWGGYSRMMNVFTLNKESTFLLNVDYNYTYAGRNRETTYTHYSSLNVGFKGLLYKKKLIIGLNFEDILKDNYSTYRSASGEVQQSFTQYYDTRLTRISLSYNFGNNKIGMSKRNVGNQEERNRSN